jgi:hypothetical protein
MTDNPPLQMDSSGLMNVFSRFLHQRGAGDTSLNTDRFQRLSDYEIEREFRSSTLIQKIIKKYPMEAMSIGYELVDRDGNVINSHDRLLLESFKEASIFSRLYGRCFLVFEFDDTADMKKPVKKESKLLGYSIKFDSISEGDFYNIEGEKIYHERVIEFVGVRTYSKFSKTADIDYTDSVLQGLFQSLRDYVENNQNAKLILGNLSYLTVGIDNLGNMSKSSEGQQMIFDRLSTLNINRSINRTIAFDKKSEEIGFITQTLSGVKDIIQEIKEIFTSETDYPVEELFEQSPGQKLGSGVQNQLISRYLWARRCKSWVINNWLGYYQIYFNRITDMTDININIPFIVDLTEEERANIENVAADRTKKLIEAGVIDASEARTAYSGDKFTLNIELDDANFIESRRLTETQTSPVFDEQLDSIPGNAYWDNLANITTADLEEIAEEILKT